MKRLIWVGLVAWCLGCEPTGSPGAAGEKQALAEAPELAWTHTAEDGTVDARGVVAGPDGGIVLVGNTELDRGGKSEAWILHLDRRGELVFRYTLGGGEDDELYAISSDGVDGWIVAGTRETRKGDVWISRLDRQGDVLWELIEGGAEWEHVNAIVRSTDGMLIVAGSTRSRGMGDYDAWIAKINLDGKIIWEITRGGEQSDHAQGLAATRDGGAVISGHTGSRGQGKDDIWAFSIDADGLVLWDRTYGGKEEDIAYGIVATKDHGFILSGQTGSTDSKHADARIIKIDEQGEVVWDRQFESETKDEMHAITSAVNGGFVAAGTKAGGIWIIGLNGQGQILWERAYPADAQDVTVGITQASDGAYGVVGFKVHNSDWNQRDAWAIRLEPVGVP